MDITALAKEVAEDEGIVIPSARKRIEVNGEQLNGLSAFARGVAALTLRNKQGLGWEEIAKTLGFKSAGSAYKAAVTARKKLEPETRDDLRFRQRQRLDDLYEAIEPSIKARNKYTPRAVEVAVKILEREARLEGLDVTDAAQDEGQKAIIINIQPHPGDSEAKEIARKEAYPLLQAPVVDVQQFEEVHLPDRGNGVGEDVERSVLGSEET